MDATAESGSIESIRSAERMLDKLRMFAVGLDPDERELLAALVGPGVVLAHGGTTSDDPAHETPGTWTRRQLPAHLAAVIDSKHADLTDGPAS